MQLKRCIVGVAIPGVLRGSQSFGIRVIYENQTTPKNIGDAIAKTSTVAGYTAASTALVGNTALATVIDGAVVIQVTKQENKIIRK